MTILEVVGPSESAPPQEPRVRSLEEEEAAADATKMLRMNDEYITLIF